MKKVNYKVLNNLKNITEGHIIYFFEDVDEYIKNVVDFVISGLEQDHYSIILENDRIIPLLKKSLAQKLTKRQLDKVKYINNFHFYFFKGNFRSQSIFEFLPSLIEGYSQEEIFFRSWAHVEWGDEREVHKQLVDSEKEADIIVGENRLLSVCAYDAERVSEELKENLLTYHDLLMDEDSKQEKHAIKNK